MPSSNNSIPPGTVRSRARSAVAPDYPSPSHGPAATPARDASNLPAPRGYRRRYPPLGDRDFLGEPPSVDAQGTDVDDNGLAGVSLADAGFTT